MKSLFANAPPFEDPVSDFVRIYIGNDCKVSIMTQQDPYQAHTTSDIYSSCFGSLLEPLDIARQNITELIGIDAFPPLPC